MEILELCFAILQIAYYLIIYRIVLIELILLKENVNFV